MNGLRVFILGFLLLLSISTLAQSKVELLKEKLATSEKEDKPRLQNALSSALLRENRSESLAYAEDAIKLSEELDDVTEKMGGYLNKAKALSALNRHEEAIKALNVIEKVDRNFGNDSNLGYVLSLMGKEYTALKKYSEGRKILQESYNLYKKLGDEKSMGFSAADYANLVKAAGDNKEAIEWYTISLTHYRKVNDKYAEVQSLMAIGALHSNRGDFDKSISTLEEAKKTAVQAGMSSLVKTIEKNLGVVRSNKEFKDKNITEVDKDKIEDVNRKFSNYENLITLSDDKISELSEAKQILELRKRLDKEAYENDLKQKEEAVAKAEQDKKLAETQTLAAKALEEKAAAKNDLLAAENAKQNTMIVAGAIGLALFAILILFILKGYRDKKKANDALVAKNTLIEKQKSTLENQKMELEQKNHNIKESLDYAKKIQTSILPPIGGLKNKFSDSFVFFKPKDIVSGDFYWYYEHGSKIYVSVSDCTGHGVPGAFMSIIGNNLIEKAIVEKKIERPADVLKFMSDGINQQLGMTSGASDVKDGMDMALVCIDKNANKLSFAGARNPLYFLRNGELEEIKATKMSVGYNSQNAEADFDHLEIDLIKGDRLYMFSDGYADQKGGPKGKKFYYKPFREILQGTGSETMQFQRDLLETTIVEWMDGAEQLDDILVLGIEI